MTESLACGSGIEQDMTIFWRLLSTVSFAQVQSHADAEGQAQAVDAGGRKALVDAIRQAFYAPVAHRQAPPFFYILFSDQETEVKGVEKAPLSLAGMRQQFLEAV